MSLALDLAILSALRAEVARRESALKVAFRAEHGRGTQYATLDGQEVGTVSVAKPSTTWSVRDEPAFTRWVKDTHPTEIVQAVSGAFKARVLTDCKAAGAPVDRNGEIVPGVESFTAEQGSVRVTVSGEQEAVLVAGLTSGDIAIPFVPLALEGK